MHAGSDTRVVRDYFNMGVGLAAMSAQWAQRDKHYRTVSAHIYGARMLRQDPVECVFEFICSSNNHISRIGGMVEHLCRAYGTQISTDGASLFTLRSFTVCSQKLAGCLQPKIGCSNIRLCPVRTCIVCRCMDNNPVRHYSTELGCEGCVLCSGSFGSGRVWRGGTVLQFPQHCAVAGGTGGGPARKRLRLPRALHRRGRARAARPPRGCAALLATSPLHAALQHAGHK